MDRTARLIQTSEALTRRIYASLPERVRLGFLLISLNEHGLEEFGRLIYAEFLKKGIPDMPDPGFRWNPKAGDNAARTLPHRYGMEFATSAWKIAVSHIRNPEIVDDALSAFAIRFLRGGSNGLDPAKGLKGAQNYVIKGLINQAKNIRTKRRTHEDIEDFVFDAPVEEHHPAFEVHDDRTLEEVGSLFPDWKRPEVQRALEKEHPDAVLYIQLRNQGYSDVEIIGDPSMGITPMLPHPVGSNGAPLSVQNWNARYKKRIYQVLNHFIAEAAV